MGRWMGILTLWALSAEACAGPGPSAVEAGAVPAVGSVEAGSVPAVGSAEAGAVPATSSVVQGFPPPTGAVRAKAGPFGTWLQALPLRAADVPVLTHDGRVVRRSARVVDLPVVRGDLQQCADSALRLRARWLREQGQPISFHATSGDPMPWARYAGGEEPYEKGGRIAWKAGGDRSWDGWLRKLFTWAGTRSLAVHDTVADDHPDAGDVLVEGGSPGHAVVVLDVAARGDRTFLLVGQGFMPAQDFHVPLGPHDGWWLWDEGLELPWWSFDSDALRAWSGPGVMRGR